MQDDDFKYWPGPDWNGGVPIRFQYNELAATKTGVVTGVVELEWRPFQRLCALKKLPRKKRGVYRICSLDAIIDRCAGKDLTGTLYVGMAGEGKYSTLHNRVYLLKKRTHEIEYYAAESVNRQRFPWDSLAVQWSYPCMKQIKQDRPARFAEKLLFRAYIETFGELPPWNEKK